MQTELGMEHKAPTKNIMLMIGFIIVAFNLRPAITSIGPLIGSIREDLQLTNGMAGLLTTLPVLAFALLSIFAPVFGRKVGNERAIFTSMLILIVGILIRSIGLISGLFIGTALIGVGIAISNVLLPGIIKEKFPTKIPLMMGIYTGSLGLFAGIAVGLSVPLAQGLALGWQRSLVSWVILAILGLVFWTPQMRKSRNQMDNPTSPKQARGNLFRSKLAWQVTLFMGFISFLFYCVVAWLPEIIHSYGFSYSIAGWMAAVVQFVGIPVSFATPILAGKLKNQKGLVIGISSLFILGLVGLMFVSASTWALFVWIVVLGVAQGSGFSLAMTFFVLRADSGRDVANLSGMAQSFGYLLAAVGPILAGFLFDISGSWTLPLITFIIVTFLLMLSGLGAGRSAYVLQEKEELQH